jgi:photosystem II stability/assembly factor-like uncharacterized protein
MSICGTLLRGLAVITSAAITAALAACGPAATPAPSSPAPAATPASRVISPPASAASKSAVFGVLSVTFISADRGFALGSVGCGHRRCAALLGTTDGGVTWRRLTAPTRALGSQYSLCANGRPCVGQIRFATAAVGYAFSPALLMTTDGGQHWRMLARTGVSSLEIAGRTAVRIAGGHEGCNGLPYRVESAAVGTDAWRNVPAPAIKLICPPALFRQGTRLVLAGFDNQSAGIPQPARLDRSADGGASWASGADQCGGRDGYASAVALAPPSTLVILCQHQLVSTGRSAWLRVSADNGATFGPDQPLPLAAKIPLGEEVHYQLAAATPGRFVVLETTPDSYRVYRTEDAGRSWSAAFALNGFALPVLTGFDDPLTARIGQGDVLRTTHDGARTWQASSFVPVS